MRMVDEKKVVTPVEPTEIAITNEERLAIENAQLKIQILQGQLDSCVKEVTVKYKIYDVQEWSYNPTGKFIRINKSDK